MYRSFYLDYLIREEKFPRRRYKREITRFFVENLAALGPGSVLLDVGCGAGRILAAVRDDILKVGVDMELPAVRFTRSRVGTGWFAVSDGKSLPFRNACFDAVLSSMVIEHVPNEEPLLAEMTRVLRPGGLALVVTPNYGSFLWRVIERIWFEVVGHARVQVPLSEFHCNRFDEARLKAVLERYFESVLVRRLTFGMTLAAKGRRA